MMKKMLFLPLWGSQCDSGLGREDWLRLWGVIEAAEWVWGLWRLQGETVSW